MTDVKGKFKDDAYTYAEDRPGGGGGGPRSMKIMGPGIAQGGLLFGVDPNPHANAAYNDSGQASLYAGFAKQFDSGWPTRGTESFKPIKDVADLPRDEKAKALKMQKSQQVQAIKNYNEAQAKAETAKLDEAYRKAAVAHINSKKGIKFSLGTETYKLG